MRENMNIIEAITLRQSRRTYTDKPLGTANENLITSLCHKLSENEADCTALTDALPPEIRFIADVPAGERPGTYGVIKGARNFLVMASGPSVTDKILAGMRMESLVLACTQHGLDTCWLGGTFGKTAFQEAFDKAGDHMGGARAIANDRPESVSIVIPVGYGAADHRFTERIMRRICQADIRKPFAQLFEGISAPPPQLIERLITGETAVSEVSFDDSVSVALECVRRAPSSSNSQPWRAKANRDIKGHLTGVTFSCATYNRFSAIDMGIAYCHFIKVLRFFGTNFDIIAERPSDLPGLFFKLWH